MDETLIQRLRARKGFFLNGSRYNMATTPDTDCAEAAERIEQLEDALNDMIDQFGYVGRGKRTSGGLSALEHAFGVLGLSDPHPAPAYLLCDEPGCGEERTCGTPTPTGYRSTCSRHAPSPSPSKEHG